MKRPKKRMCLCVVEWEGEKYRGRYARHFAQPVIHEQDLQHEELLACYPEQWAQLVKSIMEGAQ